MRTHLWKASHHTAHERIIYIYIIHIHKALSKHTGVVECGCEHIQACHIAGRTADNLLGFLWLKVIKQWYETFLIYYECLLVPTFLMVWLTIEGRRHQQQANKCAFVDVALPRNTEIILYARIHYSLVWTVQFDTRHSFTLDTGVGGKRGRMFSKITCEFNFLVKQRDRKT